MYQETFMFDMQGFIAKATAFVNAAEKSADDGMEKAEDVLRGAADWVAALRQNLLPKQASPEREATVNALIARCHTCCPDCDPSVQKQKAQFGDHSPKGFGLPNNPILTMVFTLLQQLLTQLIVTPQTPPAAQPTT